jgi:ABC-2 type transport system permease protein
MKKTLQIIRYELVSALSRPSFVFFAFGVPIIAVLGFLGYSLIKNSQAAEMNTEQTQEENKLNAEGYVDYAGLIKVIPSDLPANILVSYQTEAEAKDALELGEIEAYYLVPEDYLKDGDLYYIHPETNPISQDGQIWIMRWTLYVNLLDGDTQAAENIWNPGNYNRRNLALEGASGSSSVGDCMTPGYTCESNALIQLLPIGIMAIIYISIVTGGSYLLRLVSSEKDSRVMELLLLSASPNQLLNGKVISYCLLGFFQVLAWLGAVFLILRIGGTTLNLPPGFEIPISLLVWGLVFYVLGYGIYASMMAGAGALTPKLSQYTSVYFVVSIPLFISYFFSLILAMRPHSPLAVVLSFFPLSAPIMMITRLTVGGVPFWQPALAAGLSLIMVVLIVRAVARMFRAQVLLSGQPFSISRYIKALAKSQ